MAEILPPEQISAHADCFVRIGTYLDGLPLVLSLKRSVDLRRAIARELGADHPLPTHICMLAKFGHAVDARSCNAPAYARLTIARDKRALTRGGRAHSQKGPTHALRNHAILPSVYHSVLVFHLHRGLEADPIYLR